MKKIFVGDLIVSSLLLAILVLILKPAKLLMPQSTEMMLIFFMLLSFIVFSAILWKEKSFDERDNLHRLNAGRFSFFIGTLVIITGIIVQSFKHNIDPWLIYVLIAMVLAKIASRIYTQINK